MFATVSWEYVQKPPRDSAYSLGIAAISVSVRAVPSAPVVASPPFAPDSLVAPAAAVTSARVSFMLAARFSQSAVSSAVEDSLSSNPASSAKVWR